MQFPEINNKNKATCKRREIRSYVIRSRTSNSQKKALKELHCQFAVGFKTQKENSVDPANWFKEPSLPVAIEIGFGMGENLIFNAEKELYFNWLGVETHDAGVGRVFNLAHQKGIKNLKVYHGDSQILLSAIKDQSVSWVQLFFPDPWPKKRHQKRRLINDKFVLKLAQKMKQDAKLEIATDWQDYAEQIIETFTNQKIKKVFVPNFSTIEGERSKYRLITNFEKKAILANRPIKDFCFIKK